MSESPIWVNKTSFSTVSSSDFLPARKSHSGGPCL